jgi:hypothetical protein
MIALKLLDQKRTDRGETTHPITPIGAAGCDRPIAKIGANVLSPDRRLGDSGAATPRCDRAAANELA